MSDEAIASKACNWCLINCLFVSKFRELLGERGEGGRKFNYHENVSLSYRGPEFADRRALGM